MPVWCCSWQLRSVESILWVSNPTTWLSAVFKGCMSDYSWQDCGEISAAEAESEAVKLAVRCIKDIKSVFSDTVLLSVDSPAVDVESTTINDDMRSVKHTC